jgi:hypothetical protein
MVMKRTDSVSKNMRDNIFGGTVTSKLYNGTIDSPIKSLTNK